MELKMVIKQIILEQKNQLVFTILKGRIVLSIGTMDHQTRENSDTDSGENLENFSLEVIINGKYKTITSRIILIFNSEYSENAFE